MNNITTTTNTINKNTPSLRERTHELAKAQKKAKDCEAYILICQNEINEIPSISATVLRDIVKKRHYASKTLMYRWREMLIGDNLICSVDFSKILIHYNLNYNYYLHKYGILLVEMQRIFYFTIILNN